VIHKLSNSVWNKEGYLRNVRSRLFYLLIRRVIKTDYSNYRRKSLLSTTYKSFIHHLAIKVNSIQRKFLGIINTDFDTTGQLLIRQILEKKMGII